MREAKAAEKNARKKLNNIQKKMKVRYAITGPSFNYTVWIMLASPSPPPPPPSPLSLSHTHLLQEFTSHRERELKEAEQEMERVREEAAGVVGEAKARQQEMEALRLEVEELESGLQGQRQLVSGGERGVVCVGVCFKLQFHLFRWTRVLRALPRRRAWLTSIRQRRHRPR